VTYTRRTEPGELASQAGAGRDRAAALSYHCAPPAKSWPALRDGTAHQVGKLFSDEEPVIQLAAHPRARLRDPVSRDTRGGAPRDPGSFREILAHSAEPLPRDRKSEAMVALSRF